MNQPPPMQKNRHSFRPLLFAPPQGPDALPPTLPPPALPALPKARPQSDSHIRICTSSLSAPHLELAETEELLDELCEDQMTTSINLASLEASIARAPRDASVKGALRTLEARHADLCALRDGLANVQMAMTDPRLLRMVTPDSPLAEYLRGLYAWVDAVVHALLQLAKNLRNRPDWATLRGRIEEAKNFHFDELFEPIRADLRALTIVVNGGSFGANRPLIEELEYAVERLISTAVALQDHLDERFG